MALAIGGVEIIGLVREKLQLNGGAWDFIGRLTTTSGMLALSLSVLFILSWIGSMVLYRWKGFDRLG